jgi:type II secretory pathway pseudopilin PulG
MRRSQRGASGLFIAVILLLVAAGALAIFALTRGVAQVERGTQSSDRFKVLQDALVQYVSANGRLPCPANPAIDTGDAEPAVASAVCNFPAGTVPWKAIGVRKDDAIDPWGGKISYRVYTGAAGSLTQADGASMVDCDTAEPLPLKGTAAGGLCNSTHGTTENEFLNGKGLQVTSFGVVSNNAAYVLISHGPSGLGEFTTAGIQ